MSERSLDGGLSTIRREAQEDAGKSARWGQINHISYMVFGILAIIAGVLAGISGGASWPSWLTAVAGFAAALLAGLQTFLNAEDKARYHWKKAADLRALDRRAEILASQDNPSAVAVQELSDRLEEIQGRPFAADQAASRAQVRAAQGKARSG